LYEEILKLISMLVKHNLSFLGQNSLFHGEVLFCGVFIPFEMQTYILVHTINHVRTFEIGT
jgi:hypothetical protein